MNSAVKTHYFSYAHRLYQHKGKCRNLHGHNGKVCFKVSSDTLDALGMVIDFGQIKQTLCNWIDDNWDHKCLIYEYDPLAYELKNIDGLVIVKWNPTAENMANYLLTKIGPELLPDTVKLSEVVFRESKGNYAKITGQRDL